MKSRGYGQNALPGSRAAAGGQAFRASVSATATANPDANKFDEHGSTALHYKSYDGNTKQIDRLLDALADINIPTNDKYGDTPLHKAVAGGHFEAVNALLNSGAEVDKKNKTDQTPGHYAAYHCNLRVMKALLDSKADPMAREDEYGDDWLHKVTGSDKSDNTVKKEIFTLLKSSGVTMVQNDDHKTSIDYAYNNPELIGILKEVFEDS